MKQNYVTVTICIAISYNDFYPVKRSLITVDTGGVRQLS